MPDTSPLPAARRAVFEEDRRLRRRRWIQASGGSMRPLIAPGTWLLVEFGAVPRLGEIALAVLGDRVVAHRVVAEWSRRQSGALVTKGDAEAYCDAPVSFSNLLGAVRAVRLSDGRRSALGCEGAMARAIALASRTSGRAAFASRRAAVGLPMPLREPVHRLIAALARTAALSIAILALVGLSIESARKGGEAHGALRDARSPGDVQRRRDR